MTARRLFLFLPVVFIAVFCALAATALLRGTDTAALPAALLHQQAPATPLPAALPDTRGITAADFSGKAFVVNIFASWCPPCHAEHPQIAQMAADFPLPVYGIAYKDKTEDLAAFIKKYGNPYAAIGADTGTAAIAWGVAALPETYVVDQNGIIVYKHSGPVTPADYETRLRPVLQEIAK